MRDFLITAEADGTGDDDSEFTVLPEYVFALELGDLLAISLDGVLVNVELRLELLADPFPPYPSAPLGSELSLVLFGLGLFLRCRLKFMSEF